MRSALLVGTLLPFLHFARRDLRYHKELRQVPRWEDVLHTLLGVALLVLIASTFARSIAVQAAALLVFALLGAADEYLFHRDLPAAESDVHAKEHLALLHFLAAAVIYDGLRRAW